MRVPLKSKCHPQVGNIIKNFPGHRFDRAGLGKRIGFLALQKQMKALESWRGDPSMEEKTSVPPLPMSPGDTGLYSILGEGKHEYA